MLGNRTAAEGKAYTSNSLNQYTQVNTAPLVYDTNGNLVSDGAWTYGYDYENRLIAASNGTVAAAYRYDPFGRRVARTVNSTTTSYLYDGDQVIAEYDASGALLRKYTYGPGIDEPILLQKGADSYYYHRDGLGSVTELTNSSGSVVESYSYDAFGKTTIHDSSGNPLTQSALGNRVGFTGRELDPETGLYFYRARYYSSTLGRFLQTDPVGYTAGINLYSYCSNSPTNFLDPRGLDKQNGLPWYDRLALYAALRTAEAQGIVLSGLGANAADIYLAALLNSLMEFGMGTLQFPSAIGHLGEGSGRFLSRPSLETSPGMLMDISIIASALAAGFSAISGSEGGGINPTLDEHAIQSMQKRGMTYKQIQEAVQYGDAYSAIDKTAGGQPATRYVHPQTGRSVVINNQTGKVIHVGGEGFKY